MTEVKCPHSVIDYICPIPGQPDCQGCPVYQECRAKVYSDLCQHCGMSLSGEREVFGSGAVHGTDGTIRCSIRQEAVAKENAEIADNMRSYWANLNNGSA